jgi:hypothetical protein
VEKAKKTYLGAPLEAVATMVAMSQSLLATSFFGLELPPKKKV